MKAFQAPVEDILFSLEHVAGASGLPGWDSDLAAAGDSLFTPVMLQDVTVTELIKNVAEIIEAPSSLFTKILMEGPNKISIKLTDEFLR